MRTKKYTKDLIIAASIKLLEKEGEKKFTARNIAKQMGSSTQPIYLEFQNMDNLKEQVFASISTFLFDEVFPKHQTGDPVVDIGLNFIDYANKKPQLFKSLYMEHSKEKTPFFDESYYHFSAWIKTFDKYQALDELHLETLHTRFWITIVGLSVLTTSGILKPTREQLIHTLTDFIDLILANPNPVLIH